MHNCSQYTWKILCSPNEIDRDFICLLTAKLWLGDECNLVCITKIAVTFFFAPSHFHRRLTEEFCRTDMLKFDLENTSSDTFAAYEIAEEALHGQIALRGLLPSEKD